MDNLSRAQHLDSMTGKEFEALIVRLVRKLGLKIESQSTGPDGGIDILAKSEADLVSGYYIIQCKRYSNKVGVGAVRDLFGVISDKRANKGILITNNEFTRAAVQFASDKPIELIGGRKLSVLLQEHLGEMFKANDNEITLTLSMLAFAKSWSSQIGRLKKMIDEQQEDLNNELVLLKPKPIETIEEAVRCFGQHWNRYENTVNVLLKQMQHSGYTHVEREKAERWFALIKKTIKELLRLQVEAHSLQVGNKLSFLDPLFKQLKIVHATLLELLSVFWANQVDAIQKTLESPAQFIDDGNIELSNTLKRPSQDAKLIRCSTDLDFAKYNIEIKKLHEIFTQLIGPSR